MPRIDILDQRGQEASLNNSRAANVWRSLTVW